MEEYLLGEVPPGAIWLYLWQNRDTVVIGRNQNPWKECRLAELKADGGILVRRPSGGGAVFHDLGNLNYTILTSSVRSSVEDFDVCRLLTPILAAVRGVGVPAEFSGRNDLVSDGRKFSGTAHYHHRGSSLLHGTLLVNSDLERLGGYLKVSKAKIASKGIDSVRARVMNLVEVVPELTVSKLEEGLIAAFAAERGLPRSAETLDPGSLPIQELVDKYGSWEWTFGETPPFDAEWERRFDWGELHLGAAFDDGLIRHARFYTDAMNPEPFDGLALSLRGSPWRRGDVRQALSAVSARCESERRVHQDVVAWVSELCPHL